MMANSTAYLAEIAIYDWCEPSRINLVRYEVRVQLIVPKVITVESQVFQFLIEVQSYTLTNVMS